MKKGSISYLEYAKIILNKVSFCEKLMEKEYQKAMDNLNSRDKIRLKTWVKSNFNLYLNNPPIRHKSSNFKKLNNMLFQKPLSYLIIGTSLLTFSCNQNNGEEQNNQSSSRTLEENNTESRTKEVSDKELENFADVMQVVQEKQQKSQEKMMQYMEDQDMDLETYREIMNAQQNQGADNQNFSQQEINKFNKVNKEIEKINKSTQNEISEVMGDHQLDEKRFQEILNKIQQDPDLQQKFQQITEE